ncbi:hypothetical protein BKA65DRAFT_194382 [Rhexocercosporidium sp. MPI-PUGE-AT-0058]|nr:hypothetical protein BKA65DRAFT_194382 [Rhexocercosporidium sp. MPI-PUGE-AT-0058]
MDNILERLRDENEQAARDLVEIKNKMMPCYKVGFWIRQRNREEDWVRRGGKSSWFPASITCDCSTHYADPLSDASILYFTDELEEIDSTNTDRWAHYKQQYHVPPSVALDNQHFSKFLDVLKGYANMQRYADEGSTSMEEAAKFLKDSELLIEKIYSAGVFKLMRILSGMLLRICCVRTCRISLGLLLLDIGHSSRLLLIWGDHNRELEYKFLELLGVIWVLGWT